MVDDPCRCVGFGDIGKQHVRVPAGRGRFRLHGRDRRPIDLDDQYPPAGLGKHTRRADPDAATGAAGDDHTSFVGAHVPVPRGKT